MAVITVMRVLFFVAVGPKIHMMIIVVNPKKLVPSKPLMLR